MTSSNVFYLQTQYLLELHTFKFNCLPNNSLPHEYPIKLSKAKIGINDNLLLVVKILPASAGDIRDVGSIPGWERSPGEGHGNLFQYSRLGNSMDRRAWWATVHGITKS